jgi:hypothetical protein
MSIPPKTYIIKLFTVILFAFITGGNLRKLLQK